MSTFLRRFLFDPGNAVLLNIESVNILDLDPPAAIKGIGTGTVLLVGEFENGPVNTIVEVTSAIDFTNQFGSLGYTYNNVSGTYPCAVSRKADATLTAETWNGNSFVQLNAKQFARLLLCRADSSVGSASFSPLAYITGASKFRYTLSAGQVLGLDIGAGSVSATFTATAGTVTSAGATYAVVNGDTVTLGYDGAPNFTTTFLTGDNSQANVIARINQFAGFAFAAIAGGQFSITGRQLGSLGQVRVVGASSGGVLTALGLSVATTFGTGNVQNIAAITPQEVVAVVNAAVAGTLTEIDQNGAIRVSNTTSLFSSFISVTSATTAADLGFTVGQIGTTLGVAQVQSVGGTQSMALNDTVTLGIDNGNNFVVTFAGTDTTPTLVAAKINTAAGFTCAAIDGAQIRLFGSLPGGQVRVIGASSNAVLTTKLGLTVGTTVGVGMPLGVIPAGTVVQVPATSNVFVTMQDIAFGSSGVTINAGNGAPAAVLPNFGPYPVRIRHAVDDTTGVLANAGTVTLVTSPIGLASFSVTNPLATTAALTETQLDAAYTTAFNATLDLNTVAKQANVIFCARQSNQVRRTMRSNVLSASANGCFGRVGCVRTPMGTTKALAQSTSAEPGVGAYRDQRVFYCWPQASTFVPLIARRGVGGGVGFTATGIVDVGADGVLASILSQLPPEENPGQVTAFTAGTVGLESSANAAGLQIGDYTNFKAAGICALRIDDGVAIFQSGVTSVDPNVYPQLTRISRRRMADFIQDSLALRSKAFGKKLSTNVRRKALASEIRSFCDQLLARANPAQQRIAGFTIDTSSNTPDTLGQGLYKIIVKVRTLSSLDSIVLETTVGEQVQVNEVLPQAA